MNGAGAIIGVDERRVTRTASLLVLITLVVSFVFPLSAEAATYVSGVQRKAWGGFPATAYGTRADIRTPAAAITTHPYTIKVVVGNRYSGAEFQRYGRLGWVMNIGETKPKHVLEGWNSVGDYYMINLSVGGSQWINWNVSNNYRIEYEQSGRYKPLVNGYDHYYRLYTSSPYGYGIMHDVMGRASNTGNDLRASIRNAEWQSEKWVSGSWGDYVVPYDEEYETDASKYWNNMISSSPFLDDFDLDSYWGS